MAVERLMICPSCRGSGREGHGENCSTCAGTRTVPARNPERADRELLPWEIRVPKSQVVGDVNAESSCRVYVEDGQHWMEDRDGSAVPLIILRAERVRIVDDSATDLAAVPTTAGLPSREEAP